MDTDYEEIKPEDEVGKILKEEMSSELHKQHIMVGKDRTVFTSLYLPLAEEIKNFEVYNDDVWVMSYPKTGTTWTQEMVWLIANDLDFGGAKKPLTERFPYFDASTQFDRKKLYEKLNIPIQDKVSSVKVAKNVQRPRFLKTHLPFSCLPEQLQNGTKSPKMICIIRNPKDTCVSFYHLGGLFLGWKTSLENFTKVFLANKAFYGSYWKHVFGYWSKRHLPNLLIIKYEDMKSNLSSVIKTVAQFLGKKVNEEQVQLLCKHLSFESMKSNPAVNLQDYIDTFRKLNLVVKDGAFIRTGIVGKYKEELSPETITKFNDWIKENVKGTELEDEDIFQI